MTTAGLSKDSTVPDKGTLFCPECGHRSRYDGDWRVIRTVSNDRYRCPECRTEITSRPRSHEVAFWRPDSLYQPIWETWEASLRMWQGVWERSIGLP